LALLVRLAQVLVLANLRVVAHVDQDKCRLLSLELRVPVFSVS
jgi:hypothetical protein